MLDNLIIQNVSQRDPHNFESDLLFHQIALMSVKPLLTTTQNEDTKGKNHGTYKEHNKVHTYVHSDTCRNFYAVHD